MAYEMILVETRGRVGLATLNRPKALNALNDALMNELGDALAKFDADEGIGAMVVTGSDKAFAAGADIGAMKDWGYMDVYKGEYITRNWERMKSIRKPIIAAVAAQIAEFSLPSVMMAKEAVNRAYEAPLAEGMLFERRLFHALFGTEDQKEGMAAFLEKRKPSFKHR